ncbi:MAG: PKD domain-containing protein [Candidatus Thermoplasmatota archaeon]|nr:PKD domain-containing protein [Candidatus Thermoplasmatota archaeon]
MKGKIKVISLFVLVNVIIVSFSFGSTARVVENNKGELVKDNITIEDLFPFTMKKTYSDFDMGDIPDSPKPLPIETPDYFNWADYNGKNWVSPVRDQGYCGSCWCFAAVAVLESAINIEEDCPDLDLDLSEQYVLSCLPKAGSCRGGMAYRALKYILDNGSDGNNCNGILLESCLPYQASDTVPCEDKCSDWMDHLISFVDYGKWNAEPEDRELIKADVMEKGPVAVSMCVTKDFLRWIIDSHNPDDYFHFQEEPRTNHVVLLVGWNDDASIEKGGYWICKNSWGKGYGYNGFFNIEYGSLHIDDSNVVSITYDPTSFNCPPQVFANGYYTADIDEIITFDGRGSFDAENEIESYMWDLGDGTEKTGLMVEHTYQQKGIYSVSLTATDKDGKTNQDQTWAFVDTVNNPPNKPEINGPAKFDNLTWVNFTFRSEDSDNDNVYFYIDWDEAEIDEWIGPYESGEEVLLRHYWAFEDNYEIKVKTKDIYGDESEWATLQISTPKNKQIMDYPFFRIIHHLLDRFGLMMK